MEPETPNVDSSNVDSSNNGSPAAEPDTDPATWDPERSARTIQKQRASETALKQENKGLREAVQSLAAGRTLTPAAQALVDAATPAAATETDHYKKAFSDLSSALLGTEFDGDADRLVAAARSARIEGALTSVIVEAGADLALTRLAVAPGLANIDPASPSLAADLAQLVGSALLDHKALKRQTFAPVSGSPFPAGSGGGQASYITPEAIAMAGAEQVHAWRAAGLLEHLGYGGDRK